MNDEFDRRVAEIHRRALRRELFSAVLLVALVLLLWAVVANA